MSWCRSAKERRGIRHLCRQKIVEDVINPVKQTDKEWLVLILGPTGMNLISTCFTTEEILSHNIAAIERLDETRDPLQYLSALYILIPSRENIELLLQDFASSLYKRVHLAFLSAVPDEMFENLITSVDPLKILTFVELDILFLPFESQVFSLNDQPFFKLFFNSNIDIRGSDFESTAKKLVTLLSTLEEVPLIRYRRSFIKSFIFAETLQNELDAIKSSIWKAKPRTANRCQLLVLDRGFDCISPLLHEFTFQAMAYDLLAIKDDIYEYTLSEGAAIGKSQTIPLSEEDQFWGQLRHEHIANVAKIIQNKVETDTLMEKTSFVRKRGLANLSDTIKQFILSKKNETFYSYRHMANECMKKYCAGINISSQIEQNLATGITEDGNPVKYPLKSVMNILTDSNYELYDKLRLLLLYVFFMKGITKQAFDDILSKADLPFSSAAMITNILHLDVDIFRPGRCISVDEDIKRSEDLDVTFKQSRWKPLIRDVLLSCVRGDLSEDHFPFYRRIDYDKLIPPQRTDYWCEEKKASKLIIFIAGGVTYSEMCCAYEIMEKNPGWEIYIGGDTLLTPTKFIDKLAELPTLIFEAEMLKLRKR